MCRNCRPAPISTAGVPRVWAPAGMAAPANASMATQQPKKCAVRFTRTPPIGGVCTVRADFLDEYFELALALRLRDELLELLLALTLRQEILDLSTDLIKRRGPRRTAAERLDDVEAERRLHDIAHRAGLELERGFLERRCHLTLREEPEVAAVGRAALILRLRAGNCGEVGTTAHLLQRRGGLGFRRRLLFRRRALRHANQDMARVHALALLEPFEVLLVEGRHVGVLDRYLGAHFGVDHFLHFEVGARLRAEMIDGQPLRGDGLRERTFVRKVLADLGDARLDVLIGRGEFPRTRFLGEQVIGDELIEDTAKDLVPALRRNRSAGARFEPLDGI